MLRFSPIVCHACHHQGLLEHFSFATRAIADEPRSWWSYQTHGQQQQQIIHMAVSDMSSQVSLQQLRTCSTNNNYCSTSNCIYLSQQHWVFQLIDSLEPMANQQLYLLDSTVLIHLSQWFTWAKLPCSSSSSYFNSCIVSAQGCRLLNIVIIIDV